MGKFGNNGEYLLAVIGDLRASREHPDRAALQARLRETLVAVNRTSAPAVALAITAGDEFQGLLDAAQAGLAVDIVVEITEAIYPTELAFGLGWGPLATPLEAAQAVAELDGPCFHRAREALERAKIESAWAALAGAGPGLDGLVSGTFGLMAAIRGGWTEKQATYVREARRAEHYKDVAEKHSVVRSVVTESLQAAHFKALLAAEEGLSAALGELASPQPGFGRTPELAPDSGK